MAQKKPPKVGEIRIGRAGNKYNKWDGKRWVPVAAARTAGAQGRKPSVVSKSSTTTTKAQSSGGRPSAKSASANWRKSQAYKDAAEARKRKAVAQTRQGAVKKAVKVVTNPYGSSAESFLKLSGSLGKTMRTSAKNWWEGK